ncbi:MAG TPA: M15 family metallopeptidase [Patescibacteria group bacterium]|nr:M15 family metallopeptidase [Patescibacteria group bacterium]
MKSNHSWGLALDVNAPANPMTSDGVVHTNLPPNAGKIAKRYGFIWGGDYTGTRKDPMHFEFAGTKKNALARVVQLKGTRTLPIPSTDKLKGSADVDWVTLRQGDHGQKVENVQALLSVRGFPEIEVDGTYGRGMTLKVREFQKKHGIRQTGNVGPYTMKALLKANID